MDRPIGAPLGEALRRGRGEHSLQEVSRRAKVSTAYLHKLEKVPGISPSPRVLERLSGVLEIPYWTLMDLAGYIPDGLAAPSRRPDRKEDKVSKPNRNVSPTNAEILQQLQQIRTQLERLERSQDALTHMLEKSGTR